jgi:hypothetical protein
MIYKIVLDYTGGFGSGDMRNAERKKRSLENKQGEILQDWIRGKYHCTVMQTVHN